jgi:DNA-3-methyladenine glycosylase II
MNIKDPIIEALIKKYGELDWNYEVDIYRDIIESIISQQLSVKASDTIFKRVIDLFGGKLPTPQEVLLMPDEKMRACGVSFSKIKYIKGFCQVIVDKQIDLENLPTLSDEEVVEELTQLKGIGKWTAEMILIFTLKRPDIFSMGDLGLRTAVSRLYMVDRDDIKAIEKITSKWMPFRSMASRYLWKSLEKSE